MKTASLKTVYLKTAVVALVVVVAAYAIYRNRHALARGFAELPLWVLAVAFALTVLAQGIALVMWRVVLADLGSPLPLVPAARIFYVSQLGKYLPGSLWTIVGQMELARVERVPRRTSLTQGVLVLAIAVGAGVMVSVLLMPFLGRETFARYWWAVLLLPLILVALHPPIFGRVVNTGLRLLRRAPLEVLPTWRGIGKALVLQALVWLVLGVQIWVVVVGLGGDPLPSLLASVGGYALGFSLGMAAIGLPAGAGLREAVLVVALSGVLSPGLALLVALLARGIAVLADVGVALVAAFLTRRTGQPPEATSAEPATGRM
ncbi:lysylphosphatidylglycerol synthase domain-containing protein [Nocardioides albertanoniae]|uniref:lysylphosphatidylglycerol synthase domain-containing protein n=1 Tax=Nocardioides albertanoniae TaxID=1175486 RepID=UPI0014774501|nr:lysylphosphatidylglycerol synthase domain-containing protein [Nocardioides albertanoniae]